MLPVGLYHLGLFLYCMGPALASCYPFLCFTSLLNILGRIFATYTSWALVQFKLRHPEVHTMGDAGFILFGPVGREVLSAGTVSTSFEFTALGFSLIPWKSLQFSQLEVSSMRVRIPTMMALQGLMSGCRSSCVGLIVGQQTLFDALYRYICSCNISPKLSSDPRSTLMALNRKLLVHLDFRNRWYGCSRSLPYAWSTC